MKGTFLTSKELKVLLKQLEDQYGALPENLKEYAFVKSKEKIYLITRDIDQIDMNNIRINNLGMYIIEDKNNQIRLSIEGAQLFGPTATKNVHELDDDGMKAWFRGEDVDIDTEYEGFVIVKHGNDFIGSGRYKEGHLINFVPKARRLHEMH